VGGNWFVHLPAILVVWQRIMMVVGLLLVLRNAKVFGHFRIAGEIEGNALLKRDGI